MTDANDAIDKSVGAISAIMFLAIMLVVFLLAVVIVLGVLQDVNVDQVGDLTATGTAVNETLATVSNVTTSSFAILTTNTNSTCTLIYAVNASSSTLLGSSNYTQPTSCQILATHNSSFIGMDWNVTYSWSYPAGSALAFDTGIDDIQDGTINMVVNFFALMPTVGTIIAVVVLIGAIVLLIMYVAKMRNTRPQSEQGYTG